MLPRRPESYDCLLQIFQAYVTLKQVFHILAVEDWFFLQAILRSVRDIEGMKQSFTADYKPAATSLSQCVSGFSTQSHNSVGTRHNADKTRAYHHSVHAESNHFQIHLMAHLIFWSFIPWVQLERKRQASEVEMEQLLCSIVNCTQGKEKRKVLW